MNQKIAKERERGMEKNFESNYDLYQFQLINI